MTQGAEQQPPAIVLYGLQNCSHCKAARQWLMQHEVTFKTIYVDLLIGQERGDTLRELKRINPAISFPTLRIGKQVIVGFKAEAIEEALLDINER